MQRTAGMEKICERDGFVCLINKDGAGILTKNLEKLLMRLVGA